MPRRAITKPVTVNANQSNAIMTLLTRMKGPKGVATPKIRPTTPAGKASENIHPTDPAVSTLVVKTKPWPNLKHGRDQRHGAEQDVRDQQRRQDERIRARADRPGSKDR